jgi:hypothetical protein
MTTKFYQPGLRKFSGYTLLLAQKRLDAARETDSQFDFIVSPAGEIDEKMPERIVYNFSSARRNNMFPVIGSTLKAAYGEAGKTFKALYELLCDRFNSGIPFIDTYFDHVFKGRPVYRRFAGLWKTARERMDAEKSARGIRDAKGRFMRHDLWREAILQRTAKDVAKEIREDIIVCLSTGLIPFRGRKSQQPAASTQAKRRRFVGFDVTHLFYASGQLIRHVNIYVNVGKTA